MTGTLVLYRPAFRTSLGGLPQALWLSEEPGEKCLRKVKEIKRIGFRQSTLVCTIISVLMNSGRQVAQSFWQLAVIEKPRKTHSEISAFAPIDTNRAFRWKERPCGEIKRHAEHCGRCVPATYRDAHGPLDTATVFQANIALDRKVFRQLVFSCPNFAVDLSPVSLKLVRYDENRRPIALPTYRESLKVTFPAVLDYCFVQCSDIKSHVLRIASRALRNKGGHSQRPLCGCDYNGTVPHTLVWRPASLQEV